MPRRCSRSVREPEPEHDRDVREEGEGVPVVDRLVEPTDALVLDECGNGLRHECPDQCRADDDREEPRSDPSAEPRSGCSENDSEAEERAVRNRLVERIPAAISCDRPSHGQADPQRERHRRADEGGPRQPYPGHRRFAQRDRHERSREHDHSRAADREDPADSRRVAGERRAEEGRADEPGERDDTDAGGPDGGLRPRIHGEPR